MGNKNKPKAAAKPSKKTLDDRKMIRVASDEWSMWEAWGRELGYNGAGPIVRKVVTDAFQALPKALRDKIQAAATRA